MRDTVVPYSAFEEEVAVAGEVVAVDEGRGGDALVDRIEVLEADHPRKGIEKIVFSNDGAGALNCSFVGSLQLG